MKKVKIIGLMILCIFLSGCSVEYNLVIKEDKIKENINMSSNNNNEVFNNNNLSRIYSSASNTARVALNKEHKDIYDTQGNITPGIDGVGYYTLKYLNNNTNSQLSADYTYNLKEYKEANEIPNYVGMFEVDISEDEYNIQVGNFSFFNTYKTVDRLKINITTDKEVLSSNADNVTGNTYTWTIDRNNFKSKGIKFKMKLEEDKTEENKKNKIIIICCILIFIGSIAFIITTKKQKKY